MNNNFIKILGIVGTVLGLVGTLITNFVGTKTMEAQVNEAVAKALESKGTEL